MDQEDLEQNPNQTVDSKTSEENSAIDNPNPNITASNQVFDILEDDILPAKETTEDEGKHSSPPKENDLLDKKIGTFDPSPFAPKIGIVDQTKTNATPIPIPKIIQQKPPAPTIGLYPTRPPQPTPNQIPPKVEQVLPVQPPPVIKPVISEKWSGTPSTEKAKRSLQDEVTAALPANLRGDKASLNKTPSVPEPKINDQPSSLAQSLSERLGSINPQRRPNLEDNRREVVKPVRTYESDVAEIMSHKKTSAASIAIAENEKQKGNESLGNDEPPSQAWKKISLTILSLLLLGGGAFGAYYLYSQSALAPVTPVVQQRKASPSIAPSDNQAVVTVDIKSLTSVMKGITNEINKGQTPNTIKEIIVATKDESAKLVRVPALEIIEVLGIKPPDILSRSLTDDWMLGVYNDQNNQKSIFVVGTTNFFQNAFAGMLQWERVMADDLRQYLYSEKIEGISNEIIVPSSPVINNLIQGIDSILPPSQDSSSTTNTISSSTNKMASTTNPKNLINNTSTSTQDASTTIEIVQPLREYLTISGRFEDRIIKNKDVRAFRLNDGEILFLYSFFDNTHFIITDKETTMIEIVDRLEKQSFIR